MRINSIAILGVCAICIALPFSIYAQTAGGSIGVGARVPAEGEDIATTSTTTHTTQLYIPVTGGTKEQTHYLPDRVPSGIEIYGNAVEASTVYLLRATEIIATTTAIAGKFSFSLYNLEFRTYTFTLFADTLQGRTQALSLTMRTQPGIIVTVHNINLVRPSFDGDIPNDALQIEIPSNDVNNAIEGSGNSSFPVSSSSGGAQNSPIISGDISQSEIPLRPTSDRIEYIPLTEVPPCSVTVTAFHKLSQSSMKGSLDIIERQGSEGVTDANVREGGTYCIAEYHDNITASVVATAAVSVGAFSIIVFSGGIPLSPSAIGGRRVFDVLLRRKV